MSATNSTNNTALQITNFDFYGDELIAVKDNATNEIYVSINSILKGIGFTDEEKIRRRREKWITDSVIGKDVAKFKHPSNGGTQETYCISQRKLPLALAKITITPTMKKNNPNITSKLELYQDKCADVLASVFIDKKTSNDINIELLFKSISDAITVALQPVCDKLSKLEEKSLDTESPTPQIETKYKKPYNPWFAKMQPKYKLLEEYFGVTRGQLYKNILWEMENLYDIDTQQIQADYCYENNLSSCMPLDPYDFQPKYRDMIEQIVNSNLIKYGIASKDDPITSMKHITIFDKPINKESDIKEENT